jgi:hypothetical protein
MRHAEVVMDAMGPSALARQQRPAWLPAAPLTQSAGSPDKQFTQAPQHGTNENTT